MKVKTAPIGLLSAISFTQVAIFGSFEPVFTLYLKKALGFSGTEAGFVSAAGVLASLLAPFLITPLANHFKLARAKLIIALQVAAGSLGIVLALQQSYPLVLASFFLYMFALGPTIGLVNGMSFRSLGDGRSKFGRVRLGGTVGWMVIGWVFGSVWVGLVMDNDPSAYGHAFILSAGLSATLIALVLRLLKLQPELAQPLAANPGRGLSFRWIRGRRVIVVLVISFLAITVDKFYYFGAGLYLEGRGFAQGAIAPLLTIGQVVETFMLFFLDRIIARLGFKRTMALGLGSMVLRYGLLAANLPQPLVPLVLGLHGPIIALLYMTSTMTIDAELSDSERSDAHQVLAIIVGGASGLIGNLMAGVALDGATTELGINFQSYWIIPTIAAAAVFVLLNLVMRPKAMAPRSVEVDAADADCGTLGPREGG